MRVDATSWTMSERAASGSSNTAVVYAIAVWLALIQVSIAASELVLAVVVILWAHALWKGEASFVSLPLNRPVLAYAGLSLAAALFSFEPAESLVASKKLLLLLVPFLIVSVVRNIETLERLALVIVAMANVSALMGLWQYELGNLDHRIHGFMGHWMTYAGQLMAAGTLSLALLLFRGRPRWFLAGSLALIGMALTLTLTRSAWVGTAVAASVLLFLKDYRLPLVLPALASAVVLMLPNDVERRVVSFLEPDSSGWDRVYMLRAGARMVSNHPWLGVGPNMVAEVYPIYKPPEATERHNPHLHNNLVQIAAERGLPCVVAWLWLFGVAFAASVRAFQRSSEGRERAVTAGALGVLLAGFVAGSFEYNFGDSEFLMLYLFVMALPFCVDRDARASA